MKKDFICIKESKNLKPLKSLLEDCELFDKETKISQDAELDCFLVPLNDKFSSSDLNNLIDTVGAQFPGIYLQIISKDIKTSSITLSQKIFDILVQHGLEELLVDQLVEKLPKRCSIYPPLLLLSSNTLNTEIWQSALSKLSDELRTKLFCLLLDHYSTSKVRLTHLAVNNPIPESNNEIRSPTQLIILYGDFTDFWCHTVQNGIYQTWMPSHTMFSRGNIKEKARILSSYEDISDSIDIVDMYAGIGYFTLSYLKRGARRLFCWEINPYSVEGLVKGIDKNGFGPAYVIQSGQQINLKKVVESRCIIFLESNENSTERFKELIAQENNELKLNLNISHINLGLLPKSTDSWKYACEIVDCYGANASWIHVHENVGVLDLDTYMENTAKRLQCMSKKSIYPVRLEKVKTFAPDVYHIVGDFKFV
ncbi:hypothetical protein CANINC_003275 [Pichia inconspicua]|uniref:tRNA wybutosine-synthesizing protein 2 n=1 Tax=Pichia inconspicua TaxID=52247 RepID=A0A4T0X030_9ASCO|nr:hypothetical protein CANINC_003275 [[Candida] inconspicua]